MKIWEYNNEVFKVLGCGCESVKWKCFECKGFECKNEVMGM